MEGQLTQRVTVEGSTPTTATLGSLVSSMMYNITIFLRNAVGTSNPASIQATTLSPGTINLLVSNQSSTGSQNLLHNSLIGVPSILPFLRVTLLNSWKKQNRYCSWTTGVENMLVWEMERCANKIAPKVKGNNMCGNIHRGAARRHRAWNHSMRLSEKC